MDEINQNNLSEDIQKLTESINRLYRRQSPWMAFSSGVIQSLGYFVGFAIIATVLVYLLHRVPLIPLIGEWLGEVMNQALKNVKTPLLLPFLSQ